MRLLRNLAALAAGTIGVALVLAIVFLVLGWNRLHQRRPGPAPPLRVAADPSLIPRGEHLAAIACAGCHGPDGRLPLAGGDDDLLAPPGGPALGHLRAPNLTPGGALARYDDGQLARAIREGV
ncbi:MAG TPA: hypothetical protein VGU27_09070, partial [Candidatus Eisenbacteria bacterium]|nr:hypothetical protein [Candidatus Eisenbacteria bacterium]